MPSTRLIFGCGYLGSRAAGFWQQAGDKVVAVTRQANRATEFKQQGWQPIVADVLEPASLTNLPPAHTVLFAVARGRDANISIRRLYEEGLRNVLTALAGASPRVIYISSTGVYAQDDGSWVDEDSPTMPARDGGVASLAAEQVLLANGRTPNSIALRMAGLYGPGRIPRHEDLRAGKPLADPGNGWLNLIHVDDAARAITTVADSTFTGVMNVSDGHPIQRREYLNEIALLSGAPPPQFVPPTTATMPHDRGSTNKRVSNRRMMDELGFALEYPSYLEGLQASL